MFKQAVFVVLETLLFLALFLLGSDVVPVFVKPLMWRIHVSATHDFVLTGIVAMLVVYALLLAIEAARKRLKPAGGLTTLALVLALCLGLAMKIGFLSISTT